MAEMFGAIRLGSSSSTSIFLLTPPLVLALFLNILCSKLGIYLYDFGSNTLTADHWFVLLLNLRSILIKQ